MGGELEEALARWFRLTSYEARAYTALLRGCRTPKEVAKQAGIPYTRVYDVLRSLEAKGFALLGGGEVRFVEPGSALANRITQIELEHEAERRERERIAAELVKSLESLMEERRRDETTEVMLLRGLNAILSKMLEACNEAEHVIFTVRKSFRVKEAVKPLLLNLKPKERRITFILDSEIKLDEEDLGFIKQLRAEVRRGNVMLDMLIADELETIIGVPTSGDDAVAVWIRDREFTNSVKHHLLRENLLPSQNLGKS